MAAVAPVAMELDGAADVKQPLTPIARLAICVAAITVVTGHVKERAPYGSNTHDHTDRLDRMFDNPNTTRYQKRCRLSPDETLAVLRLMGFPNPRITQGRFKYNDLHRFMIYLMCMAHYHTFDQISDEVGWAVDSLERNITFWTDKVIESIDRTNCGINGWSDAEQKQWINAPGKDEFPECIGIVDGMYVQINRPKRQPALYYSQYKKYHAVLFLIVCDRSGRIRHLTPAVKPGHTSETSCFSTQLRFALRPPVRTFRVRGFGWPPRRRTSYSCPRVGEQLKLLGDGAYTGDDRVLYPFARDELAMERALSTASKLRWNYRLRRQRVLVECVIGRLRMTWSILHSRFHMDRFRSTSIVRACALLLNFMYGERGWWPGINADQDAQEAAADDIAAAVPIGDDDNLPL